MALPLMVEVHAEAGVAGHLVNVEVVNTYEGTHGLHALVRGSDRNWRRSDSVNEAGCILAGRANAARSGDDGPAWPSRHLR